MSKQHSNIVGLFFTVLFASTFSYLLLLPWFNPISLLTWSLPPSFPFNTSAVLLSKLTSFHIAQIVCFLHQKVSIVQIKIRLHQSLIDLVCVHNNLPQNLVSLNNWVRNLDKAWQEYLISTPQHWVPNLEDFKVVNWIHLKLSHSQV